MEQQSVKLRIRRLGRGATSHRRRPSGLPGTALCDGDDCARRLARLLASRPRKGSPPDHAGSASPHASMLPAGTSCSCSTQVASAEAQIHIVSVLLVIWLIIGAVAAGQRGYYSRACRQLHQGRHDRGGDPRRSPQLHGREPEGQLHRAAAQQVTGGGTSGTQGCPADRPVSTLSNPMILISRELVNHRAAARICASA